jgi:hypothetical protein
VQSAEAKIIYSIRGKEPTFEALSRSHAHAGDGAHDERVEAALDVAFPARHGCVWARCGAARLDRRVRAHDKHA